MDGIGLSDAIELMRREVLTAQQRAAGEKLQFPIQTLTIQLKVGLTKLADGKVGLTVPFVGAEIGASGGLHQETTQTITLVLGPPVNERGEVVSVAQATERPLG